MKAYDAIIIGFGKGGKTLAADLGKRGWTVALVERSSRMYGGTCINTGCIPTKALVHRAKLARCKDFASFAHREEYYRRSVAAKDEIVAALREKNYRNLVDASGITVYTGEGSFLSGSEVMVRLADEGVETLRSERIFVDTGAHTVVPPIPGIESRRVYTSTSIMDLERLPERLVIMGAGYIGLEFASIYASFGSRVTVIEEQPELLPREDRDIASSVEDTLGMMGITFRLDASVTAIEDREYETLVKFTGRSSRTDGEEAADAVLVAVGRRPCTKGLNLQAAGVETGERGNIVVDERLRTTNPAIRALGDVKGGLQFTYISLDDYRIVRDDLFGSGDRRLSDRGPVSYAVFTDPPLSHIGMGEEDARKAGRNIRVNKIPVSSIPRMKILGRTEGLLKSVIDADTDEILGCTLFCPASSEVINSVALAMKAGMKASFLHDFIFTHPSMSEALNDLFA